MKKIAWAYISFLYSILVIVTYFFFVSIAFCQIKVVDADTIVFNNEKIRLYGIDAPETKQYCYIEKEAWNWRKGVRIKEVKKIGCQIKGNISSSGEKIYHLPNSKNYLQTKISTSKGE